MKGVITNYNEEKGFGFIKDENELDYFFHISNIIDKNTFLDNIIDYYYTDFEERRCYVVNFIPGENERGSFAAKIILTSQIFNNKSEKEAFTAKIIDITYHTSTLTRISQGYKQGSNKPLSATAGGNGTYRLGYPEITKQLFIKFRRLDEIGWGMIEAREKALKINHRSNITDSFIFNLKAKLINKITSIEADGQNWVFSDEAILRV